MARHPISDAEILAQLPAARRRAAAARKSEPYAESARYKRRARALHLHLSNGVMFSIPIAVIPCLQAATDDEAADVCLTPSGVGLSWERLDVDLSVTGLVALAMGPRAIARAAGAAAGSATSAAKANAARLNGAKGGRPPLKSSGRTKPSPKRKASA